APAASRACGVCGPPRAVVSAPAAWGVCRPSSAARRRLPSGRSGSRRAASPPAAQAGTTAPPPDQRRRRRPGRGGCCAAPSSSPTRAAGTGSGSAAGARCAVGRHHRAATGPAGQSGNSAGDRPLLAAPLLRGALRGPGFPHAHAVVLLRALRDLVELPVGDRQLTEPFVVLRAEQLTDERPQPARGVGVGGGLPVRV